MLFRSEESHLLLIILIIKKTKQNRALADEYGITSYPTLIMLKDGEEVKRMTGLQQKPAIIKMIEEA